MRTLDYIYYFTNLNRQQKSSFKKGIKLGLFIGLSIGLFATIITYFLMG